MTTSDTNPAIKTFNRGFAFASALVCSLLGFAAVCLLPLCWANPVKGHPGHKETFSIYFLVIVWLLGLLAAITIPVAVWKRKFTVPWWMYPFFLVTFSVLYIVLILSCTNLRWAMTVD